MSPLTSYPAEETLLKPMPAERPTIPEFDQEQRKTKEVSKRVDVKAVEVPNGCPYLQLSSHMTHLI
jgi:hypothetical protein